MTTQYETTAAPIPMQWVGPMLIHFEGESFSQSVPLATFESPLWPSVGRGAKVSERSGGIFVTLVSECMTRSILLEAPTAAIAVQVSQALNTTFSELKEIVSTTSRYAKLQDLNIHIVGPLLYIRLSIHSGDAAGHNMATKAADSVIDWILKKHDNLKYVSISGNFCTDKKVSSVNSLMGRGKYMIAEIQIPTALCTRYLKTTPEAIVDLNIKKNLIGSIAAGSLHSANAHVANMLLAFYLATGQDGANVVEGSQAITLCQMHGDILTFSVTLPNIIVGTVGNGKELPFVKENIEKLGCSIHGANRLAAIAAATVLCGELSLLGAQTNRGELVRTHMSLERSTPQAS